MSHRLAGGGFISTSSDLVKMGSAFMQDDYISADTREVFWTPQKLADGNVNPQKYALGWRVNSYDDKDGLGVLTFAHHGGVSRGAQSWLMNLPKHKMSIAVNINSNTDIF